MADHKAFWHLWATLGERRWVKVRLIAEAEGYAMVRCNLGGPFIANVADLVPDTGQITSPTDGSLIDPSALGRPSTPFADEIASEIGSEWMKPRKFTFEVQLPPKSCSPNGGSTLRGRMGGKRHYRDWCKVQIRSAMVVGKVVPFPGKVEVQLEFFQGRGPIPDGLARFYDGDNANAACKPLIDALRLSGLIKGDTARDLTLLPAILHTRQCEHRGRIGVVVTVREASK